MRKRQTFTKAFNERCQHPILSPIAAGTAYSVDNRGRRRYK